MTGLGIFIHTIEPADATALTSSHNSLIVSILSCGTFFGALAAGDIADDVTEDEIFDEVLDKVIATKKAHLREENIEGEEAIRISTQIEYFENMKYRIQEKGLDKFYAKLLVSQKKTNENSLNFFQRVKKSILCCVMSPTVVNPEPKNGI